MALGDTFLTGTPYHAVAEGFVKRANRALVLADSSVTRLLDRLAAWEPVADAQA